MMILLDIRRRVQALALPMLAAGAAVYFGVQALEGDRGILAMMRLEHEIEAAEKERAAVAEVRQALERRAGLLRPAHIDPDLLEERSRLMLDLVGPDEVVILGAPAH